MVHGDGSVVFVHTGQSPGCWELVAAAQNGDRAAFGQLYARYVGEVSRFLGARLVDRGLVEDLTSETFLRALRRIDSVSDRGRDVGAWLTRIARNLVLDHVKSQRSRREVIVAEVADADPGSLSPEQLVVAGEMVAEVRRWVAQLPADQRECVWLWFWVGLSTAQTAVRMGRSAAGVTGLRHRAVRRLAGLVGQGVA